MEGNSTRFVPYYTYGGGLHGSAGGDVAHGLGVGHLLGGDLGAGDGNLGGESGHGEGHLDLIQKVRGRAEECGTKVDRQARTSALYFILRVD